MPHSLSRALSHTHLKNPLFDVESLYLTSAKFDQIKLYLLGDSSSAGKSQLDALFLSETFLKPFVPDSIYAVSGFSICWRERVSKGGGGIMAFVNQDLTVRRRTDLESQDTEAIWLEICPFKSKRSIILGSIYRPPSSNKVNDLIIEANIERGPLVEQGNCDCF